MTTFSSWYFTYCICNVSCRWAEDERCDPTLLLLLFLLLSIHDFLYANYRNVVLCSVVSSQGLYSRIRAGSFVCSQFQHSEILLPRDEMSHKNTIVCWAEICYCSLFLVPCYATLSSITLKIVCGIAVHVINCSLSRWGGWMSTVFYCWTWLRVARGSMSTLETNFNEPPQFVRFMCGFGLMLIDLADIDHTLNNPYRRVSFRFKKFGKDTSKVKNSVLCADRL